MTLCVFAIRTSCILVLTMAFMAGCTVGRQASVLTANVGSEEIPQKVETIEKALEVTSDPPARARAYLELASLYISDHNPSPDYGRALKALESCVAIDPKSCSSDEVKTWMTVLRELAKRRESLAQLEPEPKDFGERVRHLEDVVQKSSDASARAQTYLELASLYISHHNPSPDYGRALKALESCAAIDPAGCSSDEIKTWMAVLKELNRVSKEYRDLKNTIDKLQNIEIKIEEKRKQVQ